MPESDFTVRKDAAFRVCCSLPALSQAEPRWVTWAHNPGAIGSTPMPAIWRFSLVGIGGGLACKRTECPSSPQRSGRQCRRRRVSMWMLIGARLPALFKELFIYRVHLWRQVRFRRRRAIQARSRRVRRSIDKLSIRNFAALSLGAGRLYIDSKRDSVMDHNPTTPIRAAGQMETWELMEKAIPRGEAERVAKLMGYTADYVRRWRRQREANEDDEGARHDPVANLLILFDALRAWNRADMIPVIMDYIASDLAGGSQLAEESSPMTIAQAENEL
jgi:hypothetical protein